LATLRLLDLPGVEVTAADVRGAYKRRALELHPDRGGDPRAFAELTAAKDRALTALERPTPGPGRCQVCRGRGKVERRRGFYAVQVTCPACHGRGRA
jgi:DnaJ-class molecular chaperone